MEIVTVFLIKMLTVEIMLFLTMSPGQMCQTGSSRQSSYVTLTFAGFLFFAHTLAQKHKLGPISKLAQISQNSENILQKGSSHDYQTSIWNQLSDRQLCINRQKAKSINSWSVQFFCNSFAVLDQGRFLWGGIFIATSAQYSGQPPLATPHSRTQIVTQRTRKRTSVDTEWSGLDTKVMVQEEPGETRSTWLAGKICWVSENFWYTVDDCTYDEVTLLSLLLHIFSVIRAPQLIWLPTVQGLHILPNYETTRHKNSNPVFLSLWWWIVRRILPTLTIERFSVVNWI